jgi:hypothetical protein
VWNVKIHTYNIGRAEVIGFRTAIGHIKWSVRTKRYFR